MKVFNLTKTMRMSVDIHKMVEIFQKEIEKEVVDVPLSFKTRFSRKSYAPSSNKIKQTSRDTLTKSPEQKQRQTGPPSNRQNAGTVQSVHMEPQKTKEKKQVSFPERTDASLESNQKSASVQSVRKKTSMAMFHDPEKLLTDIDTRKSASISEKLSTSFSYVRGQSGHQIKSDSKPNLIYLNNFRFDFNQFNDIDAAYLSAILRKLMNPDVQLTVICSSIEEVAILKYIFLYHLEVSEITTFAPSLTENYPNREEKKRALKTEKVLLTCYRGFRGCEMDHCILFANPNDNVPKNLYIEMLTRAINFMDIIILPVKKRTFGRVPRLIEIFQKWLQADLIFSTNAKLEKIGESTQIRFSTVGKPDEVETISKTCDQNIEQQLLQEVMDSTLLGHSSTDVAVE